MNFKCYDVVEIQGKRYIVGEVISYQEFIVAPSMTYRATSPLTPFDANTGASKSNSARVARTINEMTRNRYNTKTSNRAHRIGEKYGFGSVGARTSSGTS